MSHFPYSHFMKSILSTLVATAVLMPFVQGVTTFDFDGASPATTTGSLLPSLVTVQNAYYETLDDNGDPLATPGFRADASSPLVAVGDPAPTGYGTAISGNALDGTNGPVMFTFSSALNLSNFGVRLDNSTQGNIQQTGGNPAFGTNILFYDAADHLIGFIGVDQTVAGFSVADIGTYNSVSKLILPSGAFYDNMSFNAQAVPEPSAIGLAGLGILALLKRRRA
jgi:PEP-CTERM motif